MRRILRSLSEAWASSPMTARDRSDERYGRMTCMLDEEGRRERP